MPLLFSLLLFFLSCPAIANYLSDDESPKEPKVFHVDSETNLTSTIKFAYDKPRIVVKSVYPQLSSEEATLAIDNFNRLVTEIVAQEIENFKTEVKQRPEAAIKKKSNNNLYIDYATSSLKSGKHTVISIRFSIQGIIIGKQNPYHYHRVLNYDLKTDEEITLESLFEPGTDYLSLLSAYVRHELSRRFENRTRILAGTEPRSENFRNWNIKPNGLLLTFDVYQVAPYSVGAQTVLVPFSVIKEYAATDSSLAVCIQQKRKCSRNNLLTGGFIDEAINARYSRLNPMLSQL